jgi:hypothetical protein
VLCGKKAERERESLCSQQNKHTFIETVVWCFIYFYAC